MYLITTHDENVAGQPCAAVAGYTLCRWFAYSSTDMVNWTDHGTIASWSTFSWAADAAWAPQVISRNGKFYLYAPLNNKSGATVIGVGVSTSPIGPYQDAIGQPLVTAGCSGGTGDIDPTVFIDDDGQAYLYFGRSVPGYVKLNSDMVSYSGGIQCPTDSTQTFGPAPAGGGFPTQYEEGPWIMKHGGEYYLAYAANGIPEDISYSRATAPVGPFTYGGTIMKAAGASFTNHTGIIDFNGHSYFFYHDGALQKGGSVPANGDGYHRSVCLEEFTYNADGSFPTITPTTGGPEPIAHLNPFLQTEAETIAWESGVQTEVTSDTGGGMDVTNIQNGDYIKVKSVDFGTGATSFSARVASSTSGGSIELHLDNLTSSSDRSLCRHGYGWCADVEDAVVVPGHGRDGGTRPVPTFHRRKRRPVQRQLVEIRRPRSERPVGCRRRERKRSGRRQRRCRWRLELGWRHVRREQLRQQRCAQREQLGHRRKRNIGRGQFQQRRFHHRRERGERRGLLVPRGCRSASGRVCPVASDGARRTATATASTWFNAGRKREKATRRS